MKLPTLGETIMLKKHYFEQSDVSLEDQAPMDIALSLEEKVDELEYAIYGRLTDPSVLANAEKAIIQEQWEYRTHDKNNKPNGTLRTRKINEGERYELTVKAYKPGGVGVIETNLDSDEDMHDAIANLADRCIRKVRYVFPVDVSYKGESYELMWEVDRFIRPDGEWDDIIKIDFEVKFEDMSLPTLPFPIDDAIVTGLGKRPTEEEFSVIDGMFKRVACGHDDLKNKNNNKEG